MDNIKIICGDATELLTEIESETVDLIIADPPYNLGKNYGNNSDKKEFDEYLAFTNAWLTEAKRILKPKGTIYVFMGVRFISYLYSTMDRDLNLLFNSWIVWHYTQGLGKTKGFSPRHDDVLMFTKSKDFIFNLDNIRVPQKFYRSRNNMRGANPGDVWGFSHVHYCNENRQKHPTQKPEGLIERMILASSNEKDFIIDPFSGSGTTARVCQQLNRHFLGMELNQEYIDNSLIRLENVFTGFDSVDEKMARIPNDLNNDNIRTEYLNNHVEWFLKHHPDSIDKFYREAKEKYGHKKPKNDIKEDGPSLFDFIDDDSITKR